MAIVNVNSTELIRFSKKLDLISKRSLPNAVRNTLNNVAFDAKKKHIPQEAKNSFTQRNPSFYKRFSRVEMAKGSNINTMQSKAGMIGGLGGAKQAGDNQEQQQTGGKIGGRAFIPFDEARSGESHKKNVKRKNRLGSLNIGRAVKTKFIKGTPKRKYVRGIMLAAKNNRLLIHESKKGNDIVYRVKKGGDIKIRDKSYSVERLYSVEKGRKVKISKGKPFTLRAGLKSAKRTERYFKKNAERQLKRIR